MKGTDTRCSVEKEDMGKSECAPKSCLRGNRPSRFRLAGEALVLRRVTRTVVFCLFPSILFTNCASVAYQPVAKTESIRPAMTAPTALRKIHEGLQNAGLPDDPAWGLRYQNIEVSVTRYSYTEITKYAPPKSRSFRFNELPPLKIVHWSGNPNAYHTEPDPWIWWENRKFEHARGFVDAVNAMKYYVSGADVADDAPKFAKFQEEARAWRALPVKPGLPEGVRRSQLLAEDAIKNKNFEEAIDYYEQGLNVSPLWPEGQFNAALLYGEMGIYGQAVIHMKRYLELKADAPDSQAARDQVVIWQAKIR